MGHELPADRRLGWFDTTLPVWDTDYDSPDALGLPLTREQLARLAMRPDATVIRVLLRGRDVRLRDVVMIAARRPTTPAIVAELIAQVEWMAQPSVRNAVPDPARALRAAPTEALRR